MKLITYIYKNIKYINIESEYITVFNNSSKL